MTFLVVTDTSLEAVNAVHQVSATITQLHSSAKYPYVIWLLENIVSEAIFADLQNGPHTIASTRVNL